MPSILFSPILFRIALTYSAIRSPACSPAIVSMQAINRLSHQHAVENGMVGVGVMVVTIALTAVLVKFQHYVVKKTGSIAINADSLHYVGDLLLNLSVIVALLLSIFF